MVVLKTSVIFVPLLMITTTSATDCQTPDDHKGHCKPLEECPVMSSLLESLNNQTGALKNQTISYLRRSRCGGSKTNPRVCCPKKTPVRRCFTPDFQEGECKQIKRCSVLYSLLDHNLTDENILYLRKSRCGRRSNKNNPKVCCPKVAPVFQNLTKTCQTPQNQSGQCKPISECTFLYSLLDNLFNETRTYLRESRCDVPGNKSNPNVCCPSEAPIFQHTTRMKSEERCQMSNGQIGTCKAKDKCFLPLFNKDVSKCGISKVCCPTDSISLSQEAMNLLPQESDCGAVSEQRIVGGNKTNIDEFPWMALLQYELKNGSRQFGCGGTLISKRYVLTAKHCLKPSLKIVRLGEWDTTTNPDCVVDKYGSDCAPKVLDVPIEEQIPYRDKTSFQNDIGLLRLSQEVEFGDFLRPICLPTSQNELTMYSPGKRLVVAGWGKTEQKVPSNVKLKVLVPVIELSQCVSRLREAFQTNEIFLQDSQICAGGEKGKDTCNGDSGGPLMYLGPQWYIAGIVSYGANNPCGQADTPSVFVKVSKYVRWIVDNLKP